MISMQICATKSHSFHNSGRSKGNGAYDFITLLSHARLALLHSCFEGTRIGQHEFVLAIPMYLGNIHLTGPRNSFALPAFHIITKAAA